MLQEPLLNNEADEKIDSDQLNFALEYKNLLELAKPSLLKHTDPSIQAQNILREFNQDVQDSFVTKGAYFLCCLNWLICFDRGQLINSDEWLMVQRYNQVQLVGMIDHNVRLKWYPRDVQPHSLGTFKQTDLWIKSTSRSLVNVPEGQIAKAWLGTVPVFLGPGPHIFGPNFTLDQRPNQPLDSCLVPMAPAYLKHGYYNILNIPKDKIAKIWLQGQPFLLGPGFHAFMDASFKLVPKNAQEYFEDASTHQLVHGSIKRILTSPGEVAYASDGGRLNIIQTAGEPFLVNSPLYEIGGFLSVQKQTLVFPSEKIKEERKNQNWDAEKLNYESFRTKDGLPIGVNLLVVYQIVKPALTLTQLPPNDISPHVERRVVAEMGRLIQDFTSSDFQNFQKVKLTQQQIKTDTQVSSYNPSAPSLDLTLQNGLEGQLAKEFEEIGINLETVRIAELKILDKDIANKMAEFSLKTIDLTQQQETAQMKFYITQQTAQQTAEQEKIAQQIKCQNIIQEAKATAEAEFILAQKKIDTVACEKQAKEIQLALLAREGEIKTHYPALLTSEIGKNIATAIAGKAQIMSPQLLQTYMGSAAFFNPCLPSQTNPMHITEENARSLQPKPV